MSGGDVVPCPKCGAPLSLRIGQYECARCGYFAIVPAAGGAGAAARRNAGSAGASAASAPPARGVPLLLDTPQQPPSRYLQDKPVDRRARWMFFEKLAFLILYFAAQCYGGSVLLNQQSAQTGAQHGLGTMLLAALVATAFAAWFLYIDWGPAKRVAIWLIVIALFGYGISLWSLWDPSNRLLLNKLAGDALLLLWLLSLMYRDMQDYE